MPKAKSKKPTSLSLDDVVLVKDEPPRKPIRALTQKQVLDRFGGISRPCLLAYEKQGKAPRARTLCGRTIYIEHEIEECILTAPIRKLRGDAE